MMCLRNAVNLRRMVTRSALRGGEIRLSKPLPAPGARKYQITRVRVVYYDRKEKYKK